MRSIDTPFELVKKDINDTFAGLSFDASVLPVPEQNTVAFCGDMDTSVVDNLGHDLVKIAKIGTVILIAVAILLVAANCALEWYKWRCLKNHMQYTREAWTSDPSVTYTGTKSAPTVSLSDHNLMLMSGNMQHPLLTRIANQIARILRFSPSQYVHLTWFFHYVFHPPALACFLIGFFGLLSVQIQLIAIGPLEHKYTQQAAASVNDFSNTIATSINASMYNQSATYASDINGRVDKIQSSVNDGLFGWVNGTTTTLNSTINTFYTDVQDLVNTVFNGTILEEPVQEFVRCFIGSKVDAIENALTFLHDNLIIDIPRVNDSVLVLSPGSVNEAVRPIATAAIGGGSGDSQGVVGKLVNAYVVSLKKERIMFSIFMGLWGVVVLMALAVIFWHSYGRDWLEAYRKRRWQKTQRAGMEGIVVPFRERGTLSQDTLRGGDAEKVQHDLPTFPSPPPPEPKPGFFERLRSQTTNTGANLTPHPYPLGRNPVFEKSWESFLDHASEQSEHEQQQKSKPGRRPTIGSPRKLQPTPAADAPTPSNDDTPWLKRFTTSFWKRKNSQSDEEATDAVAEKSSMRERVRPQLTITTTDGHVERLDNASNANNDGDAVPSSAWSVSPRKPTWRSTLSPPKLPTLRAKPQHRASVPADVHPANPGPLDAVAPFAVPLHHGFDQPPASPSRSRSNSFPPPPPPSMQFPAYASPTYTNHHLSPPPTASMSASGPRERAEDPFATPFDDRHAVPYESPAFERKGTNPFMAL